MEGRMIRKDDKERRIRKDDKDGRKDEKEE